MYLIHGQRNTRLYRIWGGMKARCNRPSHPYYPSYGGKGIKVCSEWETDFNAFYEWAMANGYSDELSIDRKDNNKGYEPGNCRFVTQTAQIRNRTISVNATISGETKSLAEWAVAAGLNYQTVHRRFKRGERGEKLIAPLHERVKIENT